MTEVEQDFDMMVDGIDFRRLIKAVERSYDSTKWARTQVRNLVREFTGPAYGGGDSGTSTEDKPINKLNQLIETYMMLTAANRPAVQVERDDDPPFARLFQEALNELAADIELDDTLRQWILDAFFCVGVVQVHRDSWMAYQYGEEWIDSGTPMASNVPLDDFVYDTAAKKWKQVKYCGSKYRVPFSSIAEGVESGKYDAAVAAQLKPTSKLGREEDRTDRISTGEITDDDELEPMIDLCDIYVRSTGYIYTCAIDDSSVFRLKKLPPLGKIKWTNPLSAPYIILGFSDVPHNIMPLSPASHLDLADRTVNSLARKEINQAERQKEVLVSSAANEPTAKLIKNAGDGSIIIGDASDIVPVKTGGVDANTHQTMLAWNEIFNILSGNLDALAGTGVSAPTLGQEQFIQSSSNRKVGSMQSRVAKAAEQLFRALGFLLWEDKVREIPVRIPEAGYVAFDKWTGDDRSGTPLDYKFKINVYDLPYNPPAAQANLLMGVLERVFLPMQQMLMAQGGQVDFALLAKTLGEMLNMEVLDDIVRFAMPPEAIGEELSGKAPSTQRNYTRTSVPSQGTPQTRLLDTLSNMQSSDKANGAMTA